MRTRLLTHLLVLAASLLGFAPAALARSPRMLRPDVMLPADAALSGGAALAPEPADTPAAPPADTPGAPPADIPTAPPMVTPPPPHPGGAPNEGPAESAATTQSILQIQVSGCSSHCDGTTQTQAAQQQTATVQGVTETGAPRAGRSAPPSQTTAATGSSPNTTRVTRGQIGCLAHCFGTTRRGVRLGGQRRHLRQLLHALVDAQPAVPASAAGTTQSAVHQSSFQRQRGLPSQTRQRQRSTQASITIQSVQVSRRLVRTLTSALAGSTSPIAAAVAQTVQSIWQLQIGCLSYCSHTRQYQRAAQTITTIQPTALPARAAAAQHSTSQSIWQLQVGCLVWCFSATLHQAASSRHLTLSSTAAPRALRRARPGAVQLESMTASQSGGAGVVIVASSGQTMAPYALPPNGVRPRDRHVARVHDRHRLRSPTTKPRPLVVTSSAVHRSPATADVVLVVVLGLVVLLASIAASRIAPPRGRP